MHTPSAWQAQKTRDGRTSEVIHSPPFSRSRYLSAAGTKDEGGLDLYLDVSDFGDHRKVTYPPSTAGVWRVCGSTACVGTNVRGHRVELGKFKGVRSGAKV